MTIEPVGVHSKNLFYPCAGRDLYQPMKECWDDVGHFWFVDPRYDGLPGTFAPLDADGLIQSVMRRLGGEVVTKRESTLTGRTLKGKRPFVVQQLSYVIRKRRRRESQERVVHLCRGLGFNALRTVFDMTERTLDIFYYRGDSSGEGGSGFYWLDWRLQSVLKRLAVDGVIFSDGSNARLPFKWWRTEDGLQPFIYKRWRLEPVLERSHGVVKHRGEECGFSTICWRVLPSNPDG